MPNARNPLLVFLPLTQNQKHKLRSNFKAVFVTGTTHNLNTIPIIFSSHRIFYLFHLPAPTNIFPSFLSYMWESQFHSVLTSPFILQMIPTQSTQTHDNTGTAPTKDFTCITLSCIPLLYSLLVRTFISHDTTKIFSWRREQREGLGGLREVRGGTLLLYFTPTQF